MPPKNLAITCFVLAAISAFVGCERYQANAAAVSSAKRMLESSGMLSRMKGELEMRAGMPTISKYAFGLAVLAIVGGFYFRSQIGQGTIESPIENRPTTKEEWLAKSKKE